MIDDLYVDTLLILPPTDTADGQGGATRLAVPPVGPPAAAIPATPAAGTTAFPAGSYLLAHTYVSPPYETPGSPPATIVLTAGQQIAVAAMSGLPAGVSAVRVYLLWAPTGVAVGLALTLPVIAGATAAANITAGGGGSMPPLQVPGRIEDVRGLRSSVRHIAEQGDVGQISHVAFVSPFIYNPDGSIRQTVVAPLDSHIRDQNNIDYLVVGGGARKGKFRVTLPHIEVDLIELGGGQ